MTQGSDKHARERLKLIALDSEDLAVFSAHLQDAILRVGDMVYLPDEQRFVIALNRFDWLSATTGAPQRMQTGLHFEKVRKVAIHGFHQDRPDDILNLLNIDFTQVDPPAGTVTLIFSGGCALRLEVDYLEGRMADLGPRWRTRHAPGHEPKA
jgi:hypothetical protein